MNNKESLQNTSNVKTHTSKDKEYLDLPLFVNRAREDSNQLDELPLQKSLIERIKNYLRN